MKTVDNDLLIKYMLGECSPEEQTLVENWVSYSSEHANKLEEFRWTWNATESLKSDRGLDIELAWQRFLDKRAKKTTSYGLFPFKSPLARWAASIALLIGILWAFSLTLSHQGRAYFAQVSLEATTGSVTHTLLDGSKVTLNTGAKLSYSQPLFSKNRHVWIENGEAYFDVTRDEDKPFIVEIGEVQIVVLGTAFHVRADESLSEVILDSGSVLVTAGSRGVQLSPGETARISKKDGLNKSTTVGSLHKYYVTGRFEAENLPLEVLVARLSDAYGQSIGIRGNRLAGAHITTTLPFSSLMQNLEVIKETLGLEIIRENNLIILQ